MNYSKWLIIYLACIVCNNILIKCDPLNDKINFEFPSVPLPITKIESI